MIHTLRRPSISKRLLVVSGKDFSGQKLFTLVHIHLQLIVVQNLDTLRPVLVPHPMVLDRDLVGAQTTGLALSKGIEQRWEGTDLFASDRQPLHQAEVAIVDRVGDA